MNPVFVVVPSFLFLSFLIFFNILFLTFFFFLFWGVMLVQFACMDVCGFVFLYIYIYCDAKI